MLAGKTGSTGNRGRGEQGLNFNPIVATYCLSDLEKLLNLSEPHFPLLEKDMNLVVRKVQCITYGEFSVNDYVLLL